MIDQRFFEHPQQCPQLQRRKPDCSVEPRITSVLPKTAATIAMTACLRFGFTTRQYHFRALSSPELKQQNKLPEQD